MFTHGQILGGTLTTPDLDRALTDYRDRLGMTVVEHGTLPADLTTSWATPASTGARFATVQPTSVTMTPASEFIIQRRCVSKSSGSKRRIALLPARPTDCLTTIL